jgi:hypothetical protein
VPITLYLALLHTLCAIIVLRMMFEYWRVSLITTLQIIPIIFGLQIFCYAVIGAPFYAMSLLTGASRLTVFGLICSILLVLWGTHIAITSLLQIQFNTNTVGMPIINLRSPRRISAAATTRTTTRINCANQNNAHTT